jgi:hypothetical protein
LCLAYSNHVDGSEKDGLAILGSLKIPNGRLTAVIQADLGGIEHARQHLELVRNCRLLSLGVSPPPKNTSTGEWPPLLPPCCLLVARYEKPPKGFGTLVPASRSAPRSKLKLSLDTWQIVSEYEMKRILY